MKKAVLAAVTGTAPLLAAAGWAWWLATGGAGRDDALAGLGAAVLGAVVVYLLLDRGKGLRPFCFGV